jgi:PmbA protein
MGLGVSVRLGEIETLEHRQDRGLGVTVFFGRRKGAADSSDLDAGAVRETVARACEIARFTGEDPHAGLPEAELMARDIPDLDLFHPWNPSAEEAVSIARRCEDAAREFDSRIDNSDGASLDTHQGVRAYGNSHGFVGSYAGTSYSLACMVLAGQDGEMQRDHWHTVSRRHVDLEAAEAVGRHAAERTVRRLGARRLGTRRVPVLYPPELARGLISHLVGAVSGPSQYREASWLLGARGEKLAPDFFTLTERPHLPRALGSAPFDGEGVATVEQALVENGVLARYVLDSYSARRLGMRSTANAGGVRNLELAPGDRSFDELVRDMGTGLVLCELLGQGVNSVTGDYSRGAAGFWVEDGEVRHPVNEITVAGKLRDMLGGIAALGSDLDTRGNIRAPSILIEEMTLAGE